MAIVDTVIINGPNIQADGSIRGIIDFTFDAGVPERRSIRAQNQAEWDSKLLSLPSLVEASRTKSDANEASEQDSPIAANKEATDKQVALAFLRNALDEENPYKAFRRFDRFNDFRLTNTWSLGQVVAALSSEGLTSGEWDRMKDRYQYLSDVQRVTVMQDYQTLIDGDDF